MEARQDPVPEERQLALLVASVRDYAIFMLDPTGHIMSWNAGARHLNGYERDEVLGKHFSIFYTEPDRVRDHPSWELAEAVREGRYEEEGWRVRKDGSTFWSSVTITAVRDEEDRLTGFAKVTRDLTERKRAEEGMRAALEELRAANAELDRFASVAAHDMTDPLRTISGFAELLCDADLTPEEEREYARHILDSSLRLSGMLQDMLTYARAGRPSAGGQPVDVGRAAGQVVADLGGVIGQRGARVDVDVPEDACVLADETDLRLVLQNLVSNAVKFGADSGPAVAVRAERVGEGAWLVVVEDNGLGIDPSQQARIFDAFHRVGAGSGQLGYGLGLAICKRLVERHGGSLRFDSRPQGGSRFAFDLPATSAAAAEDAGFGVREAT